MRKEGHVVNHKRVYRLYREEELTLPRKRRRKPSGARVTPLKRPEEANQVWSMDIVSDALCDGRKTRILTLIDEHTRESLALEVDTSITGERVSRVLDRVVASRGVPEYVRSDNGPEFRSNAVATWASRRGITLDFIEPGKPIQNATLESFNGKFRDECLNEHWFTSLADARRTIEAWRTEYNTERPHSALGYQTPSEFAARQAGFQSDANQTASFHENSVWRPPSTQPVVNPGESHSPTGTG
jgi:putative transposase